MEGGAHDRGACSAGLNNRYIDKRYSTLVVKNKKRFAQGGIQDKRESRTESGVLVRNEYKRGVQKNVREKTKERTEVNVEIL